MFLLLPVDARLRCSEVDRAWRALLADKTFYSRLNLSLDSGLARFSLPLFRAAAAKAGGQLRVRRSAADGDERRSKDTREAGGAVLGNTFFIQSKRVCVSLHPARNTVVPKNLSIPIGFLIIHRPS